MVMRWSRFRSDSKTREKMTKSTARSRVAGIAAGVGALSLALGGGTLFLAGPAAAESSTTTTNTGRPPESGIIKIDGIRMTDEVKRPITHEGCDFVITFFNFGRVNNASVSFAEDGDAVEEVRGDLSPFIGDDEALGEGDRDGRYEYRLVLKDPVPDSVDLGIFVRADGTEGKDDKSASFRVTGCDVTPPSTPPTEPPSTPPTSPPTEPPSTPPTGSPSTPPTESPSTPTEPPATPTQPPGSPSAPQTSVSEPEPSGPAVPTAIDAGLVDSSDDRPSDGSSTPAGIGLLAVGAVLLAGGGAISLRRRGKHNS
ncbi:hypothetical protein [Kribbella sp. NPDC055071]